MTSAFPRGAVEIFETRLRVAAERECLAADAKRTEQGVQRRVDVVV
ncbi:hypothetical protein ACIOC2_16280 [Streptomyces sp. NPDC088337]